MEVSSIVSSSAQRRILEFLKEYRNSETGECTPSIREIAKATELSPGYVQGLISDLVLKGVIERQERWQHFPGEAAPCRISNLYRLLVSICLIFALIPGILGQVPMKGDFGGDHKGALMGHRRRRLFAQLFGMDYVYSS